jgi:hypothetical protein
MWDELKESMAFVIVLLSSTFALALLLTPSEAEAITPGETVVLSWEDTLNRVDGTPLSRDELDYHTIECNEYSSGNSQSTLQIPVTPDEDTREVERTDLFESYGDYKCRLQVTTTSGESSAWSQYARVNWSDAPPNSAVNIMIVTDAQPAFPATRERLTQTFVGDSTNNKVVLPETVRAGELLLVLFASNSDSDGVVHDAPSGWKKLETVASGNYVTATAFARVADGSEGGLSVPVTATAADSAVAHVYRVGDWQGDLSGVAVATATTGSESLTTLKAPMLTPSWGEADTLWITAAMAADDAIPVVEFPDGYDDAVSTQSEAGGNASCSIGSATRQVRAPSQDPGDFVMSSNEAITAFTIAVQPAMQDQ